MEKIKTDFITDQYKSGIESYTSFTTEVGLWASEKYVFEKYLKPSFQILDLGCGTGRTTFPLFQLGFQYIIGVDLTPEMIESAQKLDQIYKTNVPFEVGNALALRFKTNEFDAVIFSFNGLMSIPSQANRDLAIGEIKRVLKNEGTFIFTTHDRNQEAQFLSFWQEEKIKWESGKQDARLYEFGDIIASSKNEKRQIYIHIPSKEAINNWLVFNGFELIETFYRNEKFDEKQVVKDKSGECRFWIFKNK